MLTATITVSFSLLGSMNDGNFERMVRPPQRKYNGRAGEGKVDMQR